MRALVFAGALLLGACAQEAAAPPQAAQSAPPELTPVTLPQTDGAGNRLEALTQSGARWCSSDNAWCIEQVTDAPARVTAGDQAISVPSPGSPWPYVIRVGADNAIVGLVDADEQTYSGGGARVDRVTLFQVSNGAATRLATLPIASSISIRACFGPENERQRAGACADEYRFVSRIRLDEAVMSGPPHIVLETAAASFPGRVTRTADPLAQPQLSEADHVWATDDVCSFRRTYAPISNGGYAPDTELPACTDYLEP